MTAAKHLFSVFDVTRQVFYRTNLSLGIVNLKPLIPGHVLVLPQRVVPRLADLSPAEVSDLFLAVQHVGRVIERAYSGEALTVSLQDGKSAGQSVPHVHIHIMPRRSTDFGGDNDKIYPLIEKAERRLSTELAIGSAAHEDGSSFPVPKDEDRKPRSEDEMEREAAWLAGLMAEPL